MNGKTYGVVKCSVCFSVQLFCSPVVLFLLHASLYNIHWAIMGLECLENYIISLGVVCAPFKLNHARVFVNASIVRGSAAPASVPCVTAPVRVTTRQYLPRLRYVYTRQSRPTTLFHRSTRIFPAQVVPVYQEITQPCARHPSTREPPSGSDVKVTSPVIGTPTNHSCPQESVDIVFVEPPSRLASTLATR